MNAVVIVWTGAGWYGPLAGSDSQGEVTRYYRVNTDAGRTDFSQASRDAYGQVGTPDWYDSEEEFYQ